MSQPEPRQELSPFDLATAPAPAFRIVNGLHLGPESLRMWWYLDRYIQAVGWAPTSRDVRHHLGYAHAASVRDHLERLEAAGVIERTDDVTRSTRIIEPFASLGLRDRPALAIVSRNSDPTPSPDAAGSDPNDPTVIYEHSDDRHRVRITVSPQGWGTIAVETEHNPFAQLAVRIGPADLLALGSACKNAVIAAYAGEQENLRGA